MRLTFVTPHRRATSGGVYAIENWAARLACEDDVQLAVLKGRPGTLAGGKAVAGSADEVQAPGGRTVLVPADSPAVRRLAARDALGARVIVLLQGFGTPGNPAVVANLRLGLPVIATSRWLEAEAGRHGAPVRYVPYGLDRERFHPPERPASRAPSVTMLWHRVDWKGGEDGAGALERVREASGARIRLFGTGTPPPGFEFLEAPSRAAVGALLRETAVFVCASWEEGFGMPGLEALACGAALATTDTKGGRDYALDGQTALVSAPHDAEALAANILRLLSDDALSERLRMDAGPVVDSYPSWEVSADRLREAVADLLSPESNGTGQWVAPDRIAQPPERDAAAPITVAVDRRGRYRAVSGGAALRAARRAAVAAVPVDVVERHPRWAKLRVDALSWAGAHDGRLRERIDHPDLSDIPAGSAGGLPVAALAMLERAAEPGAPLVDLGAPWGKRPCSLAALGLAVSSVALDAPEASIARRLGAVDGAVLTGSPFDLPDAKGARVLVALDTLYDATRTWRERDRLLGFLRGLRLDLALLGAPAEPEPGDHLTPWEFADLVARHTRLTSIELTGKDTGGRPVFALSPEARR